MEFSFTKQSQISRSVLQDGYRFLRLFLGFLFLNNPKDLDPSNKTILDILECFGMDLIFK